MIAGNREIFYTVSMKRCFNPLYLMLLFILSGCTPKPLVRIDLDTYLKNQNRPTASDVLLTASIEDIAKRRDLYRGKEVEVSGLITYYGTNSFWTWYILLEKGGQNIRCYAHQYRVEPGRDALELVRWAKAEKGEITVSGRLKDDGIEIRYMMYKGDTVTPYYKPSDHFMFPGRPWIR
jgi:hypothetical protein